MAKKKKELKEEKVEDVIITPEQRIGEIKRKLLEASTGTIVDTIDIDPDRTWFVTPAYGLNRILSGSLNKSIQVRTHTGLVGPETSGKSSTMAILLADAQKKGFLPVVLNAEGAWDHEFVTRWGLDPTNMIMVNSMWVDDMLLKLTEWINAGMTNLAIAVDSIGALERKKMLKDAEGDGESKRIKADQGSLQKDIKRMLKLIVSLTKFNNCVAFSAGHYYGNPSGYGDPEKIGGGMYYKLSCDTILTLKKYPLYEFPNKKTNKEKGKILGNQITAMTLKNRFYPPFQEATLSINYKDGINEMAGLIDLARELDVVKVSGSWYAFEDIKVQGGDAFALAILEKKDKFLKILENRLKSEGYSNINEMLKNEFQAKNKLDDVVKELEG